MSDIVYVDGDLIYAADAKVSVHDHGLLYGDGLFEAVRSYQGRAFRLDRHLDGHVVGMPVLELPAGVDLHDAEGEPLEADVLIGVPPHRPPTVVKESGLTGDGAWIAVDPATLRTSHEGVFAIGDVTQIKLANGLPLPKAGLFAELEGHHVAAAIAADCGAGAPPTDFDGRG